MTETTTAARRRVLSGMRPTGRLHLGNYMGALYNWVRLQDQYECYFFIADYHALTTDYADPSRLKQSVFDIAVEFLAAGLDAQQSTIFVQSHVPQHAELNLLFSMITPLGWLERVPTYKDQQEQLKEKDLNTYGFLGYPLLQAADILLYRPEHVPVGQDQVAHVELTREVARRFNQFYSPKRVVAGAGTAAKLETEVDPEQVLLPEPQALLTPSPKVPGLDGRKMSKSYDNAIYLADLGGDVLVKTRSMSNGGQRPTQHDPGDPEICPVADLHRIFSQPHTDQQIRQGCREATIRCDECKFLCGNSINMHLLPMRTRRESLESNPDTVWEILEDGAARASAFAEESMRTLRAATGLSRDRSGVLVRSLDHAAEARNLTQFEDWWGLEPAVLQRNLRELWRSHLLPSGAMLKSEGAGMWTTVNRRRIYVAAARQEPGETKWVFSAPAKSYEMLALLCWQEDLWVRDFLAPQKLYLAPWTAAKKAAGKGDILFTVTQQEGRFLLHLPDAGAIDITETERAYGDI